MELSEFEGRLQSVRARNGWRITIECGGPWIVTVYDKETREVVGSTGSTGLLGVLIALELPYGSELWHNVWK